MNNKTSEIECLVCNGTHFRKGYFGAEYEKYDEVYNISENSEAEVNLILNSEEKDFKIKHYSKYYTYVCEDCGFIMNFNKEKRVESWKEERARKQKQRMYDWTKFK
ncbi:hypothetical protein [Neobacillus cucumis]|uniref:Uncharacterized protein n=1 Tax=Neobacillus cucumis TaxID=1740721 RepID=A0A2N5HLF9_9BACI|nr:hypothetical protein [Neobacillus cucumis]PLS06359.1 hypothetical protein CVD27_07370 [Neobacillus cucumis]